MMTGMMRMEQQDFIEIAPGETVALQPGGLHVMFVGAAGRSRGGRRDPCDTAV